jgi:hypothetical protein
MRLHEPLRYDRFPQVLALSIAAIVLVGLILAIVHL